MILVRQVSDLKTKINPKQILGLPPKYCQIPTYCYSNHCTFSIKCKKGKDSPVHPYPFNKYNLHKKACGFVRGLILWSLICTTMFLFLKGVEVLFLWNVRNPSFLVFLPRKSKNRPKIGTYIQEYVPISTIFGTRSTTTKFDIRSIIIIGCQNVQAIQQLRSFLQIYTLQK